MNYYYTAKNIGGQTKSGTMEAKNESELAKILREKGFILISAKSEKEKWKITIEMFLSRLRGISLAEKMIFCRHLAVMIGAGFPLVGGLDILAKQTDSAKFGKILNEVAENIRRGKSFADSLRAYPDAFSDLFVNMVAIGETAGNLEKTLKMLAVQMKKDYDLRSKIRGAMVYPGVIVSAMVLIGILMMIYVVPSLTQTFTELGVELPASTKFVILVSNLLTNYYLQSAGGLLVLAYLSYLFLKSRQGKQILSNVFIYAPLFGPLVKKINSARFARVLSSLLSAGIPLMKSLEITSGTLSNSRYSESIKITLGRVQKGENLSKILADFPVLYPLMVTQMISVGEQTGTLSDILERLADFYEDEVSETTKNLSTIIEPLLMVIIGAVVGFFAISMIQPMYSMMGGI